MKNDRKLRKLVVVAALSAGPWLGLSGHALGQTFSSGSTGADGAFNPTASMTVTLPPSGVFNYTTVTIPAGVIVTYARNATNTPVTILATGDVTINGAINVNGADGVFGFGLGPFAGGLGGPGGFNGGNGGVRNGMLPSAGQGPGGGAPGAFPSPVPRGGRYGAPIGFVALIPLFGGSGGGGGATNPDGTTGGVQVSASGGGGGGALLIASSGRILLNAPGSISAIGGSANSANFGVGSCYPTGQPGSGGAVRLVATQIQTTGQPGILAHQGFSGCEAADPDFVGRVRFEAFTLNIPNSNSMNPRPTMAGIPGPVGAASNPALINLPTLSVSTVAGIAAPAAPGGSYTAADVSLAQGTANPIPVVVNVTNTPVGSGTAITLRVIPSAGNASAVVMTNHTGTFASSQASADVTLPAGRVSVLNASATMLLSGLIASLFPTIDGETVERVMVASADSGASTLSLVTKSGKEKRLDQLDAADQQKVAQAWQVMRETRSQ